ncbi:MAG TPA: molecular chaperone TorD family protein [Acidothermaceae bacterium]
MTFSQVGVTPDTVPLWGTAQLLADWWSDPLDCADKRSLQAQATPACADERADPGGALALAAAGRLGVDPQRLISLAEAVDTPGLVEEHERLFVGPGRTPCPPYESMWDHDSPPERGVMMATAAGAVLALYHRAGLAMRPRPGELPDHLVVECEALTWCLGRNHEPTVAHALLTQHLTRWVPRFCQAVRAEAKHPYYQALADLTPAWLSALTSQVEAQTASR